MASRSAGISVGFSSVNTASKHAQSTATITTGALEGANPYSGGNNIPGNVGRRIPLPHPSIHLGTVDDQGRVSIDPVWYRAFDFFLNVQLGGPSAPSITELSTATVSTRTQAIQAQTDVAAVSQQVVANAASLGAVVQVAQNNSLTGATQIPPVSYSKPNSKGPQP